MYRIINLGTFAVNSYIIETPKGLIAVDSGYPKDFKGYKVKLNKHGFKFYDIKYFFLTHCHDDHTGFLKELMELAPEAKLILHIEAIPRLKAGHNPHTHGASYKLMQKFLIKTRDKEKYFPSIDTPDRYLPFDGEKQFLKDAGIDIEIVALPGHTADSIGLLFSDGRMLIGDAAFNMPIAVKNAPLVLENVEALRKSWDYIIANAKEIITSHGKPIPKEKLIKHRPALEELTVLPIYE
jgi:glyoxylase-like metal-dependent hydrolase (beta-lactamase superfamily II)